jgi:hypothetical protein
VVLIGLHTCAYLGIWAGSYARCDDGIEYSGVRGVDALKTDSAIEGTRFDVSHAARKSDREQVAAAVK